MLVVIALLALREREEATQGDHDGSSTRISGISANFAKQPYAK